MKEPTPIVRDVPPIMERAIESVQANEEADIKEPKETEVQGQGVNPSDMGNHDRYPETNV